MISLHLFIFKILSAVINIKLNNNRRLTSEAIEFSCRCFSFTYCILAKYIQSNFTPIFKIGRLKPVFHLANLFARTSKKRM